MYSQRDEETHIVNHFEGRTLRFLDIGAHDGVAFSNTRRLWELGWSGVLVEAACQSFVALMKFYPNKDKRVKLVNVPVMPAPGLVKFFQCPDAVSTTDEAHRQKWSSAWDFDETFMFGVSLTRLLEEFTPPYGFVNIDVEGGNWELLQSVPIEHFGAEMFCVEYDDHYYDMLDYFRARGYSEVYKSSENIIVKKD